MTSAEHQILAELLLRGDMPGILELFDHNPYSMRRELTRLTYEPHTMLHARALQALRFLSEKRGNRQQEFFAETIRRHLWGMNDEGGNNDWSAPQVIASIIAGQPECFGHFVSYLVLAARDEEMFQDSLLQALQMLEEVDAVLVRDFLQDIARLKGERM